LPNATHKPDHTYNPPPYMTGHFTGIMNELQLQDALFFLLAALATVQPHI